MANNRFQDWQPPSGDEDLSNAADDFSVVDLEEEDIEKAVKSANDQHDGADEGRKQEQTKSKSDDDDGEYSERVKKRIARETRLKNEARKKAEELEQKLGSTQKQLQELQNWRNGIDTEQRKREAQDRQREQQALEADLETAIEEGDTKRTLELNRQLIRLAAQEEAQKLMPRKDVRPDRDGGPDEQQARVPSKSPQQPKLAREFLQANADWWEDPDHAEDREVIRTIDRLVFAEGFDPASPEYYSELISRAKRRGLAELVSVPEFLKSGDEDKAAADAGEAKDASTASERKSSKPTLGMGGAGTKTSKASGNGKVVLTQADREQMRRFKMDPDNKTHQLHWAKAKAERLRNEKGARS